jgi:Outer membrane protein beta-barrel domain
VKFQCQFSLLAVGLFAMAVSANAQAGLDAFFGVGTASAPSSGQTINTYQDGTLYGTPRLGGAFGKAGMDILFSPHFGVNGETDFRFSQGGYAGLTYRPTFYDFNAVWLPFGNRFKRVVPELEGGLGGANLKFYYPVRYCDMFVGCSSNNQYIESSNHFQLHMSAGIRFYVTSHIFIRPQIEAHWINNFYQFGSNWVPEYGGSIGWSFGSH